MLAQETNKDIQKYTACQVHVMNLYKTMNVTLNRKTFSGKKKKTHNKTK